MLRLLALCALVALCAPAQARTLCTVIADARDGKILLQEGDCDTRITPASTFKIPLALIGYDSGVLASENAPAWPFRQGYPDWGGAPWRQDTTPAHWMKYSVLWYSQEIARALGAERLRLYTQSFGYGNADFSGDPGKNNALERAWISSSLKISPLEQVAFLRRLYNRTLPASPHAHELTHRIVETWNAGHWRVHGKTGSAFPRKADGSFDRARGWGWFVGWATKGDRTLVFARLDQDEKRTAGPGGIRARDLFLTQFPSLADPLVR
jgi:beta-lactamase class D